MRFHLLQHWEEVRRCREREEEEYVPGSGGIDLHQFGL